MTLKEWQKKHKYKKIPGMHGIFDATDMEGRIVVRDIYIDGWLKFRIAPIWPDEEEIEEEKRKKANG